MIFDIGSPVTPAATNRFSPNGGVKLPSARLETMMMPRCSGSMPICWAIGKNSGARMTMAAIPSMNMPTISRMTLTMAMNAQGVLMFSMIAAVTICGMRATVRNQAKLVAAATRIITCAQVTAERRHTSNSFAQVISR